MIKSINVLVTGAGAPGIKGTIYSLKNNYDNRKVFVIGTDMRDDVVGAHLCDKFYVIPPAKNSKEYLDALLKICKDDKVHVLLPQNTFELEILANNINRFKLIGTEVVTASKTSINVANDKFLLMTKCKKLGIPVGDFYKVNN